MLLWLSLALTGWACPQQVTVAQWEAALAEVDAFAVARNVSHFKTGYAGLVEDLSCLGGLVTAEDAWTFHALAGLEAELRGVDGTQWFRGSRELYPERQGPGWLGAPPNRLTLHWDAAGQGRGSWRREPLPEGVALWVDGRRAGSLPVERPSLVQVVGAGGAVQYSGIVAPGAGLPPLQQRVAPVAPVGRVIAVGVGTVSEQAALRREVSSAGSGPLVLAPTPDATWVQVEDLRSFAVRQGHKVEVRPVDPLQHLFAAAGAPIPLEAPSRQDIDRMRPSQRLLPQNPRANTAYTAYTLEWGETRVGLESLSVGVAPRVQLGTGVALDALGIYNGQLKLNLLREGPAELALVGDAGWVPLGDVLARFDLAEADVVDSLLYTKVGARLSLRLAEPWSAHANVNYRRMDVRGLLDLGSLPEFLLPGQDLGESALVPTVRGELFSAKLVTDYRFNRRDALLLMGEAQLYAVARAGVSVETDAIPGDIDLIAAYGGWVDPLSAYSLTLAWQSTWRHLEARIGGGVSAIPWMWATGAVDLSYRFGGASRGKAQRMRRGWRSDRAAAE
ncbi:MAG: hypothetical protein JXX28_02755 [Deltaproteobacteria bacterium]|nr:hypothetical protein [Deltaproteobacteria bacterium]